MDIRAARKELGLSQAELAARLGLHQTTISRFENDGLPIDTRTKLALSALVNQAEAARQPGTTAEAA